MTPNQPTRLDALRRLFVILACLEGYDYPGLPGVKELIVEGKQITRRELDIIRPKLQEGQK